MTKEQLNTERLLKIEMLSGEANALERAINDINNKQLGDLQYVFYSRGNMEILSSIMVKYNMVDEISYLKKLVTEKLILMKGNKTKQLLEQINK